MSEANVLEDIEAEELRVIQNAMKQLYTTWECMGFEVDQKVTRVHTAWSHIQSLVKDICDEEAAAYDDLKFRIKDFTTQISELSQIMCVDVSESEGLSLIKKEVLLQREYDYLVELKDKRLRELDELLKLQKKYCVILSVEEHKLELKNEIPLPTDLEKLQKIVNKLIEEHTERYNKYCLVRQEVFSILEASELMPESPLEEHLFGGKEPLSLCDDALNSIEEILLKTRNRKLELEDEMKKSMGKMVTLWDTLKVEIDRRNEFLSSHSGCKVSTLKYIQNELARYEKEKRINLKLFIDSAREELKIMWEKCGVSETDRKSYSFTEETDDTLLALESEVEKWKAYYEEAKPILEQVEKRNRLWGLLVTLDNKARDPARFKNRGGSLLKEEKERNKLQKSISSLENDLSKTIEAYEQITGRKFTFFGEDYQETIHKQWQERSKPKETGKAEKHLKVYTPVKRPLLTTPKSAPCLPRFKIYHSPSKASPKSVKKQPKVIKKRDQDILKEISKSKNEVSPDDDFTKELNHKLRRSFKGTIVSTKVGGTRTPSFIRSRKRSLKDATLDEEDANLSTENLN